MKEVKVTKKPIVELILTIKVSFIIFSCMCKLISMNRLIANLSSLILKYNLLS